MTLARGALHTDAMESMTPLSRFAGADPKPRPTITLQVTGRGHAEGVMSALMNIGEVFTVEPMGGDVWHIGVFRVGADHVLELMRRG